MSSSKVDMTLLILFPSRGRYCYTRLFYSWVARCGLLFMSSGSFPHALALQVVKMHQEVLVAHEKGRHGHEENLQHVAAPAISTAEGNNANGTTTAAQEDVLSSRKNDTKTSGASALELQQDHNSPTSTPGGGAGPLIQESYWVPLGKEREHQHSAAGVGKEPGENRDEASRSCGDVGCSGQEPIAVDVESKPGYLGAPDPAGLRGLLSSSFGNTTPRPPAEYNLEKGIFPGYVVPAWKGDPETSLQCKSQEVKQLDSCKCCATMKFRLAPGYDAGRSYDSTREENEWKKNSDTIFLVKPQAKRKGAGKADFSYWRTDLNGGFFRNNLVSRFEYKCDAYGTGEEDYGEPKDNSVGFTQEEDGIFRGLAVKRDHDGDPVEWNSLDFAFPRKPGDLVRVEWDEADDFLDLKVGGGEVRLSFYTCEKGIPDYNISSWRSRSIPNFRLTTRSPQTLPW
ncbi:unnamed protein product [Amoebophrya sp. A120]|nr:unnamed protein product [Amoebophrya sp. A120]|eukprot:GSA120T00009962001.1